eukprot:722522-Prymnesium_polylepis.4
MDLDMQASQIWTWTCMDVGRAWTPDGIFAHHVRAWAGPSQRAARRDDRLPRAARLPPPVVAHVRAEDDEEGHERACAPATGAQRTSEREADAASERALGCGRQLCGRIVLCDCLANA